MLWWVLVWGAVLVAGLAREWTLKGIKTASITCARSRQALKGKKHKILQVRITAVSTRNLHFFKLGLYTYSRRRSLTWGCGRSVGCCPGPAGPSSLDAAPAGLRGCQPGGSSLSPSWSLDGGVLLPLCTCFHSRAHLCVDLQDFAVCSGKNWSKRLLYDLFPKVWNIQWNF